MIIGWDEILEGGLAPNATIMSWRGVLGGIEAANNDHDVIMTPTSHCYFDYYQSDGPDEPLAIGGYLPVKKVYQWNPIPNEIPTEKKKYIIGGQGNVWTEYITDFKKVEYMALTRMIALSEVLWGKNTKSYDAFASHLYTHIKYWQSVGANIANHIFEPTLTGTIIKNQGVGLKAINLPKGTQTQIKPPNQNSYQVFSNPYLLDTSGIYSVKSSFENIESQPHSVLFEPHLGNFGQIELKCQPASKYAGSGNDCLINGIEGSNIKYGGSEWLGFLGKNFDAIISFTEAQKISSVSIKCFNGEGQWIYLPDSVFIFSIDEKERERLIAQSKIEKSQMKTIRNTLTFNPIVTEKIRIQVKNFGVIPEGRQGAGHKAWLFLDEIIIK
jgi:hexosaminidase